MALLPLVHAPKTINYDDAIFFSKTITSARLPIFFILAGFFLAKNDLLNVAVYCKEMQKRIRSLFVPFMLWSSALLVASFAVMNFRPELFVAGNYSFDVSVKGIVSALFGIGRAPIHYQFWFLRNLFILVLLSPLFLCLVKRNDLLLLVLAIVAERWLRGSTFFAVGFIVYQRNLIGVLLNEKNWISFLTSVVLFIGVYILELRYPVAFVASFLLITSLSGLLCDLFPRSIRFLASFSFCIYAAHEPVLTILGRVMPKMPVISDFPAAIFVLAPISSAAIAIGFGIVLNRFLPSLYKVSTGGR